jgi:transcriptional regulator with XRE-family HTH domain
MPKPRIISEPAAEAMAPSAPRDMAKQEFARRLQRAMLEHKPMPLSQADLSRLARIGRDAVSTYVRAVSLPGPKALKQIADALRVSPADLMPDGVGMAAENEIPAMSVRQLAGHQDRVWLTVNQAVSQAVAAEVVAVLFRAQKAE